MPSHLALLLCLLLASCSRSNSGAEPDATQTIRVGALTAEVPASWNPSPADQVERLRAAGVRRDPSAEVEIIAVSAAPSAAPSLSLMTIRQSVEYTRSMGSVQAVFEEMRTAMGARPEASVEGSCAATSCELLFRMGPTGGRIRIWLTDERMHSAGCTCAGPEGCAVLQQCALPAAPGNAEPVTR